MRYLILLMALVAMPAAADVSFTVSYGSPTSSDVSPAAELSVRAGGDVYAWASASDHDYTRITQSMGSLTLYGLGAGVRRDFGGISLYAEAGAGYVDTRYRTRVVDEVIYHTFIPNFGHPPFIDNPGNFWELEQTYETDEIAPMIRIGGTMSITDRLSVDVSYRHMEVDEYFSQQKLGMNGGFDRETPDACGCLWEGNSVLDLSGWNFGIRYGF